MKLRACLVLLSLFGLQACGDAAKGNYNGVHYDIYDTRAFLELDNPSPIDYGCLNLKKKPGASLNGGEDILLSGPDAYLRWIGTDDSITFILMSNDHQTTIKETRKFFQEGGSRIISLRMDYDREISVELLGQDC